MCDNSRAGSCERYHNGPAEGEEERVRVGLGDEEVEEGHEEQLVDAQAHTHRRR